jgi:predicted TPR repeat methyltransferase
MPFSDSQGKDWAREVYLKIRPGHVIDIGPGAGAYAKLMRPHHRARWIGIEAWGPYIADYNLDQLYDVVHVADARLVDWTWFAGRADLVIIGDVLEHMTAVHAAVLLERLKRVATNLLVSIPVLHLDQGAVFGNPFERHVDHWTYEAMLHELGAGVVDTWQGDVLAYYWWRRP